MPDLTDHQRVVLNYARANHGTITAKTATSIARHLNRTQGQLLRTIRALSSRGFITTAGPAVYPIQITELGRRIIARGDDPALLLTERPATQTTRAVDPGLAGHGTSGYTAATGRVSPAAWTPHPDPAAGPNARVPEPEAVHPDTILHITDLAGHKHATASPRHTTMTLHRRLDYADREDRRTGGRHRLRLRKIHALLAGRPAQADRDLRRVESDLYPDHGQQAA